MGDTTERKLQEMHIPPAVNASLFSCILEFHYSGIGQ